MNSAIVALAVSGFFCSASSIAVAQIEFSTTAESPGDSELPAAIESTETDTAESSDAKEPDVGDRDAPQQVAERKNPKPNFYIPGREAANRDPNEAYDLTFDDLVFEMEKGEPFLRSMLTPEVKQYHGKKIKLRGYIRPSFSQTGLTKFVFVRDNKECCFGPGAALYDCVLVRLAKSEETDYTVRPVTIEGTFYLKEYSGPDGKVWSIFRMKDGQVK